MRARSYLLLFILCVIFMFLLAVFGNDPTVRALGYVSLFVAAGGIIVFVVGKPDQY
jgi:hypothetical protein